VNGNYLLDTNIIIALFNSDTNVTQNLAQSPQVFIPSIAIGELCYGAHKSGQDSPWLAQIAAFIAGNTILACDTETARRYGEVKQKLRLKGRPLPENDIWIAALAIQHDLILVTRDAHFHEIESLQTAAW
jgi:tRNA(fMet)-specific endonuclease VapC